MSVIFKNNSDQVRDELEKKIAKVLEEIGLTAETEAKQLAPVDTGRLRASLDHKVEGHTVYIGTNVEYGKYQEFGTSNMKAQPFLKPAVIGQIEKYKQMVREALKE